MDRAQPGMARKRATCTPDKTDVAWLAAGRNFSDKEAAWEVKKSRASSLDTDHKVQRPARNWLAGSRVVYTRARVVAGVSGQLTTFLRAHGFAPLYRRRCQIIRQNHARARLKNRQRCPFSPSRHSARVRGRRGRRVPAAGLFASPRSLCGGLRLRPRRGGRRGAGRLGCSWRSPCRFALSDIGQAPTGTSSNERCRHGATGSCPTPCGGSPA